MDPFDEFRDSMNNKISEVETRLLELEVLRNARILEMKNLIESENFQINSNDKHGDTCLHCTSRSGNIEIVKLLLEKNADVEVKNKRGDTPLHCASRNGLVEITELLLDNNANIETKNERGNTPLHEAVKRRWSVSVITLLLSHGANMEVKNNKGKTFLDFVRTSNYDFEKEIEENRTRNNYINIKPAKK